MNRLILSKSVGGWSAKYVGPHAERIRELFGTDTLPLPFTSSASETMVLTAILSRNPGCVVEVQ